MTAIDTAAHVHAPLNGRFTPGVGMKEGARVGVWGGSKGFRTERVERVVGDPIIIWRNRLGIESRTEGVENRRHFDSIVSIERRCWR